MQNAKKVDLAIVAIQEWDKYLSSMTKPSLVLIADNQTDKTLLEAVKNSQKITFSNPDDHTKKPYGFLINETGEIPAKVVNEIRLAISHHLNSWEMIATLYLRDRVDKTIIEEQLNLNQLHGGQPIKDSFEEYYLYMDLYGKNSWGPIRTMMKAR